MSTIPPVSVALPVAVAPDTLERAFACVAAQDHADLEILVVLNGADAPTGDLARRLVEAESRARLIELERASLPGALNAALRAARHDLIARMDADDACPPHRLRLQAKAMGARPELAAIGCAWELAEADGRVIATVRPPTDPADLRWRLLLGNVLAHGSMVLRRDVALGVGGYDEALDRAQDYDLWLRLGRAGSIAALPDVLYTHVSSSPHDPGRSTPDQAGIAALRMLRAWRELPPAEGDGLVAALADALTRDDGADGARATIEGLLRDQPTREGLLAWLWSQWNAPPAPRRAADAARRALLRETGARLRAEGVERVWLWGAGDHTRWLLACRADLGVPIAGIVDDHLSGESRFGFGVESPDMLGAGDTALASSDWHERAIWEASAPARERGVRVERLYEPNETGTSAAPTGPTASAPSPSCADDRGSARRRRA